VFWEPGFGYDPNGSDVPASLRVNIDDLLQKAEQFYTTNVEKLKMVTVGQGKSNLDKYKMQIYLLYQHRYRIAPLFGRLGSCAQRHKHSSYHYNFTHS
jgi:hypothetical protein